MIIGTRDQDTACLRAAALQDLPCRLVGMIASKRKTLQIIKNLEAEGTSLENILPRFHGPIGLDLGRHKSPPAVALSIMAEIQALRFGGTGLPMDVANRREDLLAGRRITAKIQG